MSAFQALTPLVFLQPGATRFALAPGFHIPRLWRCDPVFRAFGAAIHIPRLWRSQKYGVPLEAARRIENLRRVARLSH
jgi:hypothetical protein